MEEISKNCSKLYLYQKVFTPYIGRHVILFDRTFQSPPYQQFQSESACPGKSMATGKGGLLLAGGLGMVERGLSSARSALVDGSDEQLSGPNKSIFAQSSSVTGRKTTTKRESQRSPSSCCFCWLCPTVQLQHLQLNTCILRTCKHLQSKDE